MQVLSLSEFSRLCKDLHPSFYVLDTRNQQQKMAGYVSAVARYQFMLIQYNPNSICFRNDSSCICFEHVKYVRINQEIRTVGTVFTIVCGDSDSSLNDMLYTMIID